MARYELSTATAGGMPTGPIENIIRGSYARTVNAVGEMNLVLPDIYPDGWFQRDTRIYVQRKVGNGAPKLDMETCWFVQDISSSLSVEGQPALALRCVDAIALLGYRIVAYNANNAGIPGSLKVQEADDMMKAIVRENYGALASDPLRDLSIHLSVADDTAQAPILKKEFSRRTLIDIFKELCDSSLEEGTYLAFDIVCDINTGMLEFRTYVGQRGNDHRVSSGVPVILDVGTDTLADVVLSEKHTNEKTYVYAGGQGVADVRPIEVAFDQTRIDGSPFGRRELFVDANNTTDPVILTREAAAALIKGKPAREFSGRLNDEATVIRGIEWDYGDFLTANYRRRGFDVHVDKLGVTFNENGSVQTDAALGAED